jgi:WD40 repeat protein
VLNSFSDPHQQCFLRGHTDYISSVHISPSGRWIASGQQGAESDVIVWSYETKDIKYRLEEHQFGIDAVMFSRDDVRSSN